MILDHLIATVPDLRATHARLLVAGFDEAWPPGPFWPAATTSGIALGGANLELVQPDAGVPQARIDTLVLAPRSVEEGRAFWPDHEERDKIEPDPALLALRGFSPESAAKPQAICTNLYPFNAPYPFFLCLYAPFLRERLAPARFATPHGPLVGLALTAIDPEKVRRLFVGHLGPIELDVDAGNPGVTEIRFGDGFKLGPQNL